MFSFEGEFKKRPTQALGGASRNASRDELLRRRQEERVRRELDRKKEQSAIAIQALIRGFIVRRRTGRALRETFDAILLSERLSASSTGLVSTTDSPSEISTIILSLVSSFFIFYDPLVDNDRLRQLSHLLLARSSDVLSMISRAQSLELPNYEKVDRKWESVSLRSTSISLAAWSKRLADVLIANLRLVVKDIHTAGREKCDGETVSKSNSISSTSTSQTYFSAPPSSSSVPLMLPLRLLEVYACSPSPLARSPLWLRLVRKGYFDLMRYLIVARCPPLTETCLKPPTPLAESLLAFVLKPLECCITLADKKLVVACLLEGMFGYVNPAFLPPETAVQTELPSVPTKGVSITCYHKSRNRHQYCKQLRRQSIDCRIFYMVLPYLTSNCDSNLLPGTVLVSSCANGSVSSKRETSSDVANEHESNCSKYIKKPFFLKRLLIQSTSTIWKLHALVTLMSQRITELSDRDMIIYLTILRDQLFQLELTPSLTGCGCARNSDTLITILSQDRDFRKRRFCDPTKDTVCCSDAFDYSMSNINVIGQRFPAEIPTVAASATSTRGRVPVASTDVEDVFYSDYDSGDENEDQETDNDYEGANGDDQMSEEDVEKKVNSIVLHSFAHDSLWVLLNRDDFIQRAIGVVEISAKSDVQQLLPKTDALIALSSISYIMLLRMRQPIHKCPLLCRMAFRPSYLQLLWEEIMSFSTLFNVFGKPVSNNAVHMSTGGHRVQDGAASERTYKEALSSVLDAKVYGGSAVEVTTVSSNCTNFENRLFEFGPDAAQVYAPFLCHHRSAGVSNASEPEQKVHLLDLLASGRRPLTEDALVFLPLLTSFASLFGLLLPTIYDTEFYADKHRSYYRYRLLKHEGINHQLGVSLQEPTSSTLGLSQSHIGSPMTPSCSAERTSTTQCRKTNDDENIERDNTQLSAKKTAVFSTVANYSSREKTREQEHCARNLRSPSSDHAATLFSSARASSHQSVSHRFDTLPLATSMMPFSLSELSIIATRLRDVALGLIDLAFPDVRLTSESFLSALASSDTTPVLDRIITGSFATALVSEGSVLSNGASQAAAGCRGSLTEREASCAVVDSGVMIEVNTKMWMALFHSVMSLVRQLHARDSRIRFCEGWIVPTMILPDHITDDNLRQSHLCRRPFQRMAGAAAQTGKESRRVNATQSAAAALRMTTIIQELPFVIPFETRMQVFQQLLQKDRMERGVSFRHNMDALAAAREGGAAKYIMRRNYVYEDAFEKLAGLDGAELRQPIRVRMLNNVGLEEAGVDGGGVFREFLGEFLRAAFDPNRGFFKMTSDNLFYPNPSVHLLVSNFQQHYFFIGRMLGKAIYDWLPVELPIAGFFLSKLLARHNSSDLDIHYLSSLDPIIYKNLLYLKSYGGDVSELGLNFSIVDNELGQQETIELKANGSETLVTNENRIEYVHLMADFKLNRQIRQQTAAMKQGLSSVIEPHWLQMFDAGELQVLISGTPTPIDVADWRAHTVYGPGYSAVHPVIKCFWDVVESFDDSQRKLLLKFVTSYTRPPLLGFKEIQPPFCINRVESTDCLPTSATCMNLLKLPDIVDFNTLRSKILYAIQSASGFELN